MLNLYVAFKRFALKSPFAGSQKLAALDALKVVNKITLHNLRDFVNSPLNCSWRAREKESERESKLDLTLKTLATHLNGSQSRVDRAV